MGSNVRGFMTYKRKQYSYEAVLDNGLTVSLVPEEKLKEEKLKEGNANVL